MTKSRLWRFCGVGGIFIRLRGENALKALKRGLFSIFRFVGNWGGYGWRLFGRLFKQGVFFSGISANDEIFSY